MTFVERIQEKFSAQIVYGDPIEKDGTVLLPAVWVAGGGGGGSGEQSGSHGEGGGFGLFARPSGSWVVTSEGAKWVPAIDPTVVIVAGTFLILSYLRYRAKNRP